MTNKVGGIIGWVDSRLPVIEFWEAHLSKYYAPKNFNFWYFFGSLALLILVLQIVTGIFLTMHYKPDAELAFASVEYIMRDVNWGWLVRYMHSTGASAFFVVIYLHMLRGLMYGSFKQPRELIWLFGMMIYVCLMAEAFMGYLLPWGQMSYWAAAVITNLFAGGSLEAWGLVEWIRGGFAVNDATLTRFFMLHVFLLPLVIIKLIVIHFYTLRIPHVNNQESEDIDYDAEAEKYLAGNKKDAKVIPFWPVFLSKDFAVLSVFLIFYFYLVFFNYNFAMDPVNFDPANAMATPAHIYPEWYFLWSYETLRGPFFDMFGMRAGDIGLIIFGLAQVIFVIFPFLDKDPDILPAHKRPRFMIWFWIMIVDLIVLSVYGKLPPTGANAWVGFYATLLFILLWIALPIITKSDAKARGAL